MPRCPRIELDVGLTYIKQAESLRRQIKANEKAQADALKQREQVEDRMRQW